MKKVILVAILSMASVTMFSQTFGVKGGLNLSNWVGSDADNTKMQVGFHIGGLMELPLSGNVYLQPELLLTQKGCKSEGASYRPLYIEVPVNLMLKADVGTGKLTIGAGPYVAMGIAGKASEDGISIDLFKKIDVLDAAMLKRFDAGLGVNVGYEFSNGFLANLGTSFGLINIPDDGDASIKNSVVSLSIGYKFGSK